MRPKPRALAVSVSFACLAGAALGCERVPAPHDALERVVRHVEAVRGLTAERPVDARVVTAEALRELIERELAIARSAEDLAAYERGLVTVGLWPRERDLREELLAVLAEEVAGVYVPAERALFVVSEEPAGFDGWLAGAERHPDRLTVLQHEIVHLLQHQHHPALFDAPELFRDQDDFALAVQAAYEGDAVYYGLLAGGESPPPSLLVAVFELELGRGDGAFAGTPRLLQELLGFPYVQGYGLAYRERATLLDSPPASTEQVVHEDAFGAPFTVFDLGELEPPAGCERVYENGVGEVQLAILFQILGASRERAGEIAAGWDGDRYLAADCGGRPELFWLTQWDSEEEGEEFARATAEIADALGRRAGLGSAPRIAIEPTNARRVVVASGAFAAVADGAALRESRVRTAPEVAAFYGKALRVPFRTSRSRDQVR